MHTTSNILLASSSLTDVYKENFQLTNSALNERFLFFHFLLAIINKIVYLWFLVPIGFQIMFSNQSLVLPIYCKASISKITHLRGTLKFQMENGKEHNSLYQYVLIWWNLTLQAQVPLTPMRVRGWNLSILFHAQIHKDSTLLFCFITMSGFQDHSWVGQLQTNPYQKLIILSKDPNKHMHMFTNFGILFPQLRAY